MRSPIEVGRAAGTRFISTKRVRTGSAMILFAALTAPGCDPCSGVVSCSSSPQLELEGTLIEHVSGTPEPNVRIDVIRTGGVALVFDSVSTLTDDDGHWQIDVPANTSGDVVADIQVSPPGFAAFRSVGMHFPTTDRLGAGSVIPPWVVDPHFAYALELFYNASPQSRAANVTFEFHRTGGIGFYVNAGGDVYTATTDAAGRASLFDLKAHAIGLGDLIGDVVVHLPAPSPVDTIHDVHLTASPAVQVTTNILRYGVGPTSAAGRRVKP